MIKSTITRYGAFVAVFMLLISAANLPAAENALSRDERWRSDLRTFAEELPRLHTNLFFQMSQADFEKNISTLDSAIPSLKDHEITTEFMRLAALAGDAHTYIYPWEAGVYRRYPMQLYWFKDGIYVTATDEAHQSLLGARILKIGGRDISEVCDAVRPLVSHENEARVKSTTGTLLVTPEILSSLRVLENMEQAEFSFEKDGKTFTTNIAPVDRKTRLKWISGLDKSGKGLPLYLQNQNESYWYAYIEDTKTLYVQYNNCREMQGLPFKDFTDELTAFASQYPVERFVVDMRLNTGGSSYVAHPLLNLLARNSDLNRFGKLFVVVGRKTFSSAILNTLQLQAVTKAIFVGEPTGGKPNHYGEVKEFQLPYSGFIVSYSTKYLAPSKEDNPTFVPDILVESSSRDYFSGHDPVMDVVMGYQVASR